MKVEFQEEKEMLYRIGIIYKGDRLTSYLYMGNACLMGIMGVLLLYSTSRIGFYYLAMGLFFIALYSLGKGFLLWQVAKNRFNYFNTMTSLSSEELEEEIKYNSYRLHKKSRNRRLYIWVTGLCTTIATCGLFTQEKGLIVGTMVPIAMLSAMEFSIGLMVEFRLWEYHRMMHKYCGRKLDN